MESIAADSSQAALIRDQITRCCREFEVAWQEGQAPLLEEFVCRVDEAGQKQALYELLHAEVHYRRDADGEALTDKQLCDLHPTLMPEIEEELHALRQSSGRKSTDAVTMIQATSVATYDTIMPAPADPYATMEPGTGDGKYSPMFGPAPRISGSRGLHIRCPHCTSAIELLTDTPYESIKCDLCGSAFNLVDRADPSTPSPALKKIGRFELTARLGIGGFGTVWKARDTELDRTVALKIPRKGQLADEEIEQFFREARSAAQLQHPNIVSVHEVGRDGENIFIVSDLVRGVSMADWLTDNAPGPREVARLLMIVSNALEHAHQMGVIHRDLKPHNVLMDEAGEPHVMDFGLAKRSIGEVTMTRDGHILGTPAYMSPEQAGGQSHRTDGRTDIYSIGVMMFQMLTGELPFRGNASMQVQQRLTDDPPNPRTLNRYLPRDLCTICVKCLERDPSRRYSTAKELADELGRFLRNEPILSRPISRAERVVRWAKRKPALAGVAGLTIFLAVAGPITALVIESQRQRMAQLLAEKNAIIQRDAEDQEKDAAMMAKLKASLALWEGRGNPSELWPPKTTERPRAMIMEKVVSQGDGMAASWNQNGSLDQKVLGELALAILNDEVEHTDQAIAHYEAANQLLSDLAAAEPDAPRYKMALADTLLQLGRLRMKGDRAQAEKDIEEARALNAQLAKQNGDARQRAASFEAELHSAVMRGFDKAQDHLARAQRMNSDFGQNAIKDPAELYELACYLGGRDPILMKARAESAK
jgi:hypothetical protein